MRPLDFLGRIKVKLGLVILLAVATAFALNEYGRFLGVVPWVRMGLAAVLSLGTVQLVGRGMTRPLREMAAAAQTIAKGRYGMRVRATSRDEVGELARAFNAMAADLAEVDRQRRRLVANVSHELRTPIAGLQAVLENLVDGVSSPDRATLSTALTQTERLGRLVAQLLDLSRLDSGARHIEPEPVELGPLCAQAVREAGLAREEVSLSSRVPAGLGVHADPALLGQVLANLLDNAVRHSPVAGLVRLEARAEGAGVRFSVTDEGPGIPAPERPRVFERFSRLDTARAADAGGTGLGLAIVKEIVELHGGSVRVADTPFGCRMVVDLPGRTTVMNEDPPDLPESTAVTSGDTRDGPAKTAGAVPGKAGTPAAAGAGLEEAGALTAAGAGSAGPAAPEIAEAAAAPIDGREVAGAADRSDVSGIPDAPAVLVVPRRPKPPGEPWPAPVAIQEGSAAIAPDARATGPGAAEEFSATVGSRAFAEQDAAKEPLAAREPSSAREMGAVDEPDAEEAGAVVGAGTLAGGQGTPMDAALVDAAPVADARAPGHVPPGTYQQPSGGHPQAPGAYRQPPGAHQWPPGGVPPDYVPPPLLPRPDLPPTPRWLLPVAAAVGLLAAGALPFARAGFGIVLVAVVAGAAVLPVARHRVTPWTGAFCLLAYALVSVALFRDAEWLVGPLLLAAFGLAALAVSGAGRSWAGVIRGGMSMVLAVFPLPWFLIAPLKAVDRRRTMAPLLAGLGIAAVLLMVFGVLFASADAVFASFVSHVFTAPAWASSVPVRLVLFAVFSAMVGAATLVALRPAVEPAGRRTHRRVSRTLWTIPLAAVDLLFAAFVAVQISTLFGGNRRVMETAGLTYAEYARSGFFELVTVSVFVLGLVAAATAVVAAQGRERLVLAGLLGLLCGLTLVILASALHRLGLYIDAYGLSTLRASVGATIWWLAAVFALVLVAGALRLARRDASWLPRTTVLVTGLSLLVFSIWNPDLRVAESQLRVRDFSELDFRYITDLSADAVPAIDGLPSPARDCLLAQMSSVSRLSIPDDWAGWNLAREHARDLLGDRPPREPSPSCGKDIKSRGT
ncbi:DUF4153 domain-containing protein [Sphaerisporangium dianthi]|uniref:Signal transduction histidine-protein kinase/phosphatase MprB n=1 Tax=Sphaerisporangium dianthi TaxID=1436120 RepID=A0ABV9CNF8_9ACTN